MPGWPAPALIPEPVGAGVSRLASGTPPSCYLRGEGVPRRKERHVFQGQLYRNHQVSNLGLLGGHEESEACPFPADSRPHEIVWKGVARACMLLTRECGSGNLPGSDENHSPSTATSSLTWAQRPEGSSPRELQESLRELPGCTARARVPRTPATSPGGRCPLPGATSPLSPPTRFTPDADPTPSSSQIPSFLLCSVFTEHLSLKTPVSVLLLFKPCRASAGSSPRRLGAQEGLRCEHLLPGPVPAFS